MTSIGQPVKNRLEAAVNKPQEPRRALTPEAEVEEVIASRQIEELVSEALERGQDISGIACCSHDSPRPNETALREPPLVLQPSEGGNHQQLKARTVDQAAQHKGDLPKSL